MSVEKFTPRPLSNEEFMRRFKAECAQTGTPASPDKCEPGDPGTIMTSDGDIWYVGDPISPQPEWDALHKFDAENNVEPSRVIAYRIASKYGHSATGQLVDEISHAIEDAMELGQRRAAYLPNAPHG